MRVMDFSGVPLWVISVGLFAALLIASEAGKRLRDRHAAPAQADGDAFAMTSVLGLLALLIGFTFSIALARYEERRELVVQEANAIGTAWLRTQLLDSDDRERVRGVLRRYVDARVAFGQARTSTQETNLYRRTEALQGELWSTLMAAVASFRDSPRAALLVTSTNEAIDLAAERYAVRQAHIPSRILRTLAIFALISAGMVGYERGSQRKATTLLFILLTLAVSLVIDLDRPTTGITSVPQEPMLQLRQGLAAQVTAAAAGPVHPGLPMP